MDRCALVTVDLATGRTEGMCGDTSSLVAASPAVLLLTVGGDVLTLAHDLVAFRRGSRDLARRL